MTAPAPYPREAESPREPKPVDRSGPSKKAIIGWTVGMLAVLGLAWLVGVLVIPTWRTCSIVAECHNREVEDAVDHRRQLLRDIERLGGGVTAAERLVVYLRLPKCIAPHRETAAEMLGKCGQCAVGRLAELLQDPNEESKVRSIAACELGELGDASALQPLISVLNEDDVVVRGNAIHSLGKLASKQATLALVRQLKSRDPSVRKWAAGALYRIRDNRATEPLISALRDEDLQVRWRAAETLGSIGDARAVPALILSLEHKNATLRIKAAESLGQIGDPRATGALRKMLDSTYGPEVAAVRQALSRIRVAQAKDK